MKVYVALLVGVVVLSGCTTTVTNQTETDSLKSIIPSDWTLTEEQTLENQTAIKITSSQQCQWEVMRKPDLNPVNETIIPFIKIIYEKKWSQEDYDRENKKYEECTEELKDHLERAMACSKSTPTLETKTHSLFIYEDDCNGETKNLKDKIVNHLKNL